MPERPELSIVLDHSDHALDLEPLDALVPVVLAGEGYRLDALTVVLTDHATVLDLNRTYLSHDYHTDVLSFDLRTPEAPGAAPDTPVVDGEVYVDLDTVAERHAEFESTFACEAYRYVVHGLLHLCGYDDDTTQGKAAMRTLEDRYLAETGLC